MGRTKKTELETTLEQKALSEIKIGRSTARVYVSMYDYIIDYVDETMSLIEARNLIRSAVKTAYALYGRYLIENE